MSLFRFLVLMLAPAAVSFGVGSITPANPPDGWETAAPREEIKPTFAFYPTEGTKGTGTFVIVTDERAGLHGFWRKTFQVKGGTYYRFNASRRVDNVSSPRRSAPVRILWQDNAGKPVVNDEPMVSTVFARLRAHGGTGVSRRR
jgi:hypothetical protein